MVVTVAVDSKRADEMPELNGTGVMVMRWSWAESKQAYCEITYNAFIYHLNIHIKTSVSLGPLSSDTMNSKVSAPQGELAIEAYIMGTGTYPSFSGGVRKLGV